MITFILFISFFFIVLQTNQSNSTQVVLQNIEFNLSGQFICEVTIDTKPFSTLTDTKDMLVVRKYKVLTITLLLSKVVIVTM